MEDFILSTVDLVQDIDFSIAFKAVGIGFILIWISLAVWVWRDASQRFESKVVPLIFGLLTAIFFIFGYIAYLILRPKDTLEDKYWAEREKEFLMHEIGDYDVCPNCKYDRIFVEFLKCPECGFEIKHKCKSCNFALTKYWKHCPSCGDENAHYDPSAKEDPNTVLVGEREKKQMAMEEAREVETLNAIPQKVVAPVKQAKVSKGESPLKLLVKIYADFFSSIGNGIISGYTAVKKGVVGVASRLKPVANGKKGRLKSKANLSINSVATAGAKASTKKKKAQKKKNRKRAQKRRS